MHPCIYTCEHKYVCMSPMANSCNFKYIRNHLLYSCTHIYLRTHVYNICIHFRQNCQEQRLKRGHYKQSLKKRFVTHAYICTLCTYVLYLVKKCILCGPLVAYTKSKYVQYRSLHTKQVGQYSVLWIHSAVFPSTVS